MTQVKFNHEKWWVLLNGSWVEIKEKYWEKVKIEIWRLQIHSIAGSTWEFEQCRFTPDQIYSLPNEVEFEIKNVKCEKCSSLGWIWNELYQHNPPSKIDCPICNNKQVAHLKESEPDYSHPLTMQIIEEETKNKERSEEVKKVDGSISSNWVIINSENSLRKIAKEVNPKIDNGKSEFHFGWRKAIEWIIKTYSLPDKLVPNVSKDSLSEIETLKYIRKILDVTNTATLTQSHAAVAAIKALCKEYLGDLAPNGDKKNDKF